MKDYLKHSLIKIALLQTKSHAEDNIESPFHYCLAFVWIDGYEMGKTTGRAMVSSPAEVAIQICEDENLEYIKTNMADPRVRLGYGMDLVDQLWEKIKPETSGQNQKS